MTQTCPCLCGHPMHRGVVCECGCPRAAPDYVAGSAVELAALPEYLREPRVVQLTKWQDDVAAQLRYVGPSRPGRTREGHETARECVYCLGKFESPRSHAETCSGACKQARSVALRYETDEEVPSPVFRREVFSQERRLATGFGMMTPGECFVADMRVRALARGR